MVALVVGIVVIVLAMVVLLEWRYSQKSISVVDLVTGGSHKHHHKRRTED